MSNRLPIPGQDGGTWGGILNSFLEVSLHNNGTDATNGTLNANTVGTSQLQSGSVTTSTIANNAVTNTQLDVPTQTTLATVASKYTKPGGGIPASDLASAVQTNLTSASTSIQPTTTLTGDLGGTVASPVVAKVNGITVTGTPSANQTLIATSPSAAAWSSITTGDLPGSVVNASAAMASLVPVSNGSGGYTWSAQSTGSSAILGLTDLTTNFVTSGVSVWIVTQVAFVATGSPVRIRVAGGYYSAASAVVLTWDLYDPIVGQAIRQTLRSYPTASSNEPISPLERIFTPAAGDYVVQFRVTAATNVATTVFATATSPLEIYAESVGIA
jgi:hypothetical protein